MWNIQVFILPLLLAVAMMILLSNMALRPEVRVIGRLSLEPSVSLASWQVAEV
ncbi:MULTISPECIES: hypothetical protein [Vibrio]|uniref:hypothetical protein n=1 Tax=Vibrio TaxID=662 RepID=UPI000B1259E1|nr:MULTISPECIES: hypothetical protein [Vibrio]